MSRLTPPGRPRGELIEARPGDAADSAVFTLERAASVYFSANGKKLDQQQRVAVTRFVSWAGSDRELTNITAHQMSLFQEAQGANVADMGDRLLPVKAFLAYAKKKAWVGTNLGVHLRIKRPVRRTREINGVLEQSAEDIVEMTVEGLELARNELDRLRAERPTVTKRLAEAMADKDFRENAPLDAAPRRAGHAGGPHPRPGAPGRPRPRRQRLVGRQRWPRAPRQQRQRDEPCKQ